MLCNKSVDVRFFLVATLVVFASVFLFKDLASVKDSYAKELSLPKPNQVLPLGTDYSLAQVRGLRYDAESLSKFELLLDKNDQEILTEQDSDYISDLFLAALSFPEEDLWVNFSPYEQDRILDDTIAQTQVGRILLEQDYILKQLSSSLTIPTSDLGKKYWQESKGDSLNKVWIVAQEADVLEDDNTVLIKDSSLDVESEFVGLNDEFLDTLKEQVNNSVHFAKLRQLYSITLVAKWLKSRLKEKDIAELINSKDIKSLACHDSRVKGDIYSLYMSSLEKGTYEIFSKKEKKKYFCGGLTLNPKLKIEQTDLNDRFVPAQEQAQIILDLNIDGSVEELKSADSILLQMEQAKQLSLEYPLLQAANDEQKFFNIVEIEVDQGSSALHKLNPQEERFLIDLYYANFEDKAGYFNFGINLDMGELFEGRMTLINFVENLIWDNSPTNDYLTQIYKTDDLTKTSYFNNLLKVVHSYLILRQELDNELKGLLLEYFSGRISMVEYNYRLAQLSPQQNSELNLFWGTVANEYAEILAYTKTQLHVIKDMLSMLSSLDNLEDKELVDILKRENKMLFILKYLRGQKTLRQTVAAVFILNKDSTKRDEEIQTNIREILALLKVVYYSELSQEVKQERFIELLDLDTREHVYEDQDRSIVENFNKESVFKGSEESTRAKYWSLQQRLSLEQGMSEVIAKSIASEFAKQGLHADAQSVIEDYTRKLLSREPFEEEDLTIYLGSKGKVKLDIINEVKNRMQEKISELVSSSSLSKVEQDILNGGIDLRSDSSVIRERSASQVKLIREVPYFKKKITLIQ